MKKFLAVIGLAVVAVLAFAGTAGAADWGPPPGWISISCTTLHMDPPSGVFVTYHITVSDAPSDIANATHTDRTVEAENDDAVADISDLTTRTGSIRIAVNASWNLGTGHGNTYITDITCHEPPTTTTSTTTTTLAPTTTTTQAPTTTTTAPAATSTTTTAPHSVSTTTPTTVRIGTPIAAHELPYTGAGRTLVLGAAGCIAIVAGLGMIIGKGH